MYDSDYDVLRETQYLHLMYDALKKGLFLRLEMHYHKGKAFYVALFPVDDRDNCVFEDFSFHESDDLYYATKWFIEEYEDKK